ncbi:MAG: sugar transferase [Saprospiraceae bacterium]|nr:sugar transferase [Saprospiraceae bacterium]
MYLPLKRLFDILFALLALAILSPLFAIIIPLLRLTGEGEIFYFQKRIGYRNRTFFIWKFATMIKNSPNLGTGTLTLRNDPRVTPLGRYLRMTKINELPQLVNILKGDMSLVGPRPQVEIDFLAYPADIQAIIYNVRPGLTGIGSIIFRDEEKLISESGMPPRDFYVQHIAPYKGELERWYQQHLSFFTDFFLICLTAWVIVFPHSRLPYRLFRGLPPAPGFLPGWEGGRVRE